MIHNTSEDPIVTDIVHLLIELPDLSEEDRSKLAEKVQKIINSQTIPQITDFSKPHILLQPIKNISIVAVTLLAVYALMEVSTLPKSQALEKTPQHTPSQSEFIKKITTSHPNLLNSIRTLSDAEFQSLIDAIETERLQNNLR